MHLWPFIPQREFTESLEWLTDVIRCKGGEQRFALRTVPRAGYLFNYVMDQRQFSLGKSYARAMTAEEVLLPLWGELTYLGGVAMGSVSLAFDTRFAHYALGGLIVVWDSEEHWEIREVATLTTGGLTFALPLEKNYVAALVAPLRAVRFAQPFEGSRGASDYLKASARFTTTEGVDLAGTIGHLTYPVHRGHEVMTDRSFLISDIRERFEREAVEEDSATGKVWIGPQFTYPIQTSSMNWDTLTREDLWNLRVWLHSRRGKWRGFWLPSWNPDLEVTQPIVATDTTITIREMGYPTFEGPRDLMIVTKAGAHHYLQVTGGADGLLNQEVLALAGEAGVNLAVSDIEMVCFLTFMRFDADRIEIRHRAAKGASVAVPVMEAPVP